jgi:hypothetical protein
MNRQEFEKVTQYVPTEEEWAIIQTVYNYHPIVPEGSGKTRLVVLWEMGGMGLIRELEHTAREVEALERKRDDAYREWEEYCTQLKEIKVEYLPDEPVRQDRT